MYRSSFVKDLPKVDTGANCKFEIDPLGQRERVLRRPYR